MNPRTDFSVQYALRNIIFCGAVASASVIFSVLFLLFLNSYISPHPPFITDTVSEMMGYAEFFGFTFGSYFVVTVVTWNLRQTLQRFFPSWLPIAVGGSLLFCFSFFTRVWIETMLRYDPSNPFAQPPPTYAVILLSVLITACVLTVVTGAVTAFASNVYADREPPPELHLD